MDYSFNIEVAQKYGVNEAIFMHNLYFWIFKNEANERHFYEGRYWTYNSAEAFSKLFPFWSADQVKRLIKKMRDSGLILIGNFNQNQFNRTSWYALSDEITSIYKGVISAGDDGGENPLFGSAKSHNGERDSAPIHSAESHFLQTDINHIVNTDINSQGADKPPRGGKNKFTEPTLEEVTANCREMGYGIDPEEFIAFYKSKNWMVGKNKMSDWKAAVRTWEIKRRKNNPSRKELPYLE